MFSQWLAGALLVMALPVFTLPSVLRAYRRWYEQFDEWSKDRSARLTPVDADLENLRLWTRRCRTCAALDRIERLLIVDEYMSATRQLGNRIAHRQLAEELRTMPQAFPPSVTTSVETWSRFAGRTRIGSDDRDWADDPISLAVLPVTATSSRPGQVEVLDLGWRQAR